MAVAQSSKPGAFRKAIMTSNRDRAAVVHLAGMLRNRRAGHSPERIKFVDALGKEVDIPSSVAEVMARAVSLLAEGKSVSVLANDDLLTTGKAAEILNVSRQYLVRLIDDGAVPAVKVNRHRRVWLSDLQAYKSERDSARNAALDRLAAMSEDMGGYALSR